MKQHVRILIILLMVFVNIGCDQVSKVIVREKVEYNETIPIIKDNFILTKVENTGAFLSMGSDFPEWLRVTLLLVLPTLVLLFGLYYVLFRVKWDKWFVLGLCCIIGGGAANLFDRYVFGSVTDFLHIDLGFARTGVFNMADVSIMVGLGLLVLLNFRKKKKEVTVAE